MDRKKSHWSKKDGAAFFKTFDDLWGENSTHEAAVSIYKAYRSESQPFALFLRDFQQESYDYLKPPTEVDPQERLFTSISGEVSDLEAKLARALEGRLPVIAIWNHSDLMHVGLIPRLPLPDDRWVEFLGDMVNGASLIVMDCHILSRGVRIELETLVRLERQDSVVILLPREGDQRFERKLFEVMGAKLPDDPVPDKQSPELQSFPRVAYEDEIPFDLIESSPLFADLLDNAKRLTAGDITVLPVIEQIRVLNRKARGLADAFRIEEALQTSVDAMRLAGGLEDRSHVAQTLMNTGIIYIKLGYPDEAAQAFYQSGALFEKLNDTKGQGNAAAWLGMAYKHKGEPEQAMDILEVSLPLLRSANAKVDLIDILNVLIQLSSETGLRPKKAKQYKAELRTLTKPAGTKTGRT